MPKSKWALLGVALLLCGCGPSTPYAPLFFEADRPDTVRVGLLPCGDKLSKIIKIQVVSIGDDGSDGKLLLAERYSDPTRMVDLRIDTLRTVVSPKADVRVVVFLSGGGDVSMPLRLGELDDIPFIKVHDKVIEPSEFRNPKDWCDGVTSIP